MKSIADDPVESLEGFDHKGVLVGCAHRIPRAGHWSVVLIVENEAQARKVLDHFGAKTIVPGAVLKQQGR